MDNIAEWLVKTKPNAGFKSTGTEHQTGVQVSVGESWTPRYYRFKQPTTYSTTNSIVCWGPQFPRNNNFHAFWGEGVGKRFRSERSSEAIALGLLVHVRGDWSSHQHRRLKYTKRTGHQSGPYQKTSILVKLYLGDEQTDKARMDPSRHRLLLVLKRSVLGQRWDQPQLDQDTETTNNCSSIKIIGQGTKNDSPFTSIHHTEHFEKRLRISELETLSIKCVEKNNVKQETKVFISSRHSKRQICELDWIQTGGGGYLNPTISQLQYILQSLNLNCIQIPPTHTYITMVIALSVLRIEQAHAACLKMSNSFALIYIHT